MNLNQIQEGPQRHNGQPMHVEPSYDFDWEGLYAALGEPESTPDDDTREKLLEALSPIFDWMLSVDLGHKSAPEGISKRVISLAWCISPARFGNASIRKLSKRLGMAAPQMSRHTADASRKFGIGNEYKSHDWRNRKAIA